MPTKSPVIGKGAIAIAAQVTTENKLMVTDQRRSGDRLAATVVPRERRLRRRAPRRLQTAAGWEPVVSCLCGTAEAWESSYDAFAVVAIKISALRLSAAIRPSMPSFFRMAANSERRVATSLIALSR